MLILVKFPTQLHYNTRLLNPITQNSSKSHHTFATDLNFHNFLFKSRNVLRLKAKKKGEFTLSESERIDTFDVDFDVDDGDYDDDDEDDVFVPLDNMKQWLENRPRGFGEGKVYDTSIEDKLMEEIEQSRKAQVANLNKLKNDYLKQSVKKETSRQINNESKVIEDGFRVRLVNLPKKKNIHKDLKLAFEGVAGILNILPIVSGNEKTRDPVCKGLAFVDFKNHDDAHSFVQKFSGKNISFGKVEKQIKCEMMTTTSKSPKPPPCNQLSRAEMSSTLKQVEDVNDTEDLDSNDEPDASLSESWEESVTSDELDDDEEEESHISISYEDDGEIDDTSADLNSSLEEDGDEKEESSTESSSSSTKKGRKIKANQKKASSSSSKHQSKGKIPKLHIPGSAKRLKIREKTMLANVFSKYKGDSSLTVAETK